MSIIKHQNGLGMIGRKMWTLNAGGILVLRVRLGVNQIKYSVRIPVNTDYYQVVHTLIINNMKEHVQEFSISVCLNPCEKKEALSDKSHD